MDFELTEKHRKLKDSVRTFCEKEFDSDYALELDRKEEFPIELYRKAAKQRFSSLFIPEKYGAEGTGVSCGLFSHGGNVQGRLVLWVGMHDWNLRK